MKIKHLGDKYGIVNTTLPNGRGSHQPTAMTAKQLAQLLADLLTLPQPEMRQGESRNLARLIYFIGFRRYGNKFTQLTARKMLFGDSLAAPDGPNCHLS